MDLGFFNLRFWFDKRQQGWVKSISSQHKPAYSSSYNHSFQYFHLHHPCHQHKNDPIWQILCRSWSPKHWWSKYTAHSTTKNCASNFVTTINCASQFCYNNQLCIPILWGCRFWEFADQAGRCSFRWRCQPARVREAWSLGLLRSTTCCKTSAPWMIRVSFL